MNRLASCIGWLAMKALGPLQPLEYETMTTAIAVHRIEEQIRAKRADQLRVSEFFSRQMKDDDRAKEYMAKCLSYTIAEKLMEKATFTGTPAIAVDPIVGSDHRMEGDTFEANVVVVHPTLWAEITALLRSLR